jgi:hypothetical protein
MDYKIAIPSYNRASVLNNKTLKCLSNNGIDPNKIYIFIVEEELEKYKNILDNNLFNTLVLGNKGLIQQREYIENYFNCGDFIISLDDDIQSIDLSLTSFDSLHSFFLQSFCDLKANSAFIWGVYPVYNKFFRNTKSDLSTELKYIVGAFYGFINRKNLIKLSLKNDNKEDVERSIKYFINDGIVLRYNKIGFKTKYYGTDGGGMGKFNDRLESMKISSLYIQNKYPTISKIKIRKNGMYEIVLKSIPANSPIVLNAVDPSNEYIQTIYSLLENITIPMNKNKSGRARTFGDHRAMTLGFVKARVSRIYGLSRYSKMYPELYQAIKQFGETICPFEFTSIHVNHNVVCTSHLDSENIGNSMIVSFGDYKGCNLEIKNWREYNTNCQPIIFNGSKHFHWNTPLESGNKYSFVFFNSGK